MAFSFSNDGSGTATTGPASSTSPADGTETQSTSATSADAPAAAPAALAAAPGVTRFNTCRWQQPAESGIAAFCTHREVKPYAGTASFDADAWCPDCAHYKLRRVPKKRERDEYSY